MTTTVPCPACGLATATDRPACVHCGADFAMRGTAGGDSTTLVRLKADSPIEAQALVDELFRTLSPRFHGLRRLGQGGMGTVYVARDPLLKRDVAIKVLSPAFGADTAAHERFIREAQAAAAVAHPNVVSIFQVGELPSSRVPYFVMQYIEGDTLEQAYPHGTPVPEPVARRIISEIASALAAAHARELVHRDIKPSNVMLDPHTGRAIVLDFGISASVRPQPMDEKLTAPGVYVGTPRYMSPEQSAGEGITDKSDMYSLGCVAYELLAGHPVFDRPNVFAIIASHLRDTPQPLSEVRPGIDRELGALVMRCLEKDPDKRPTAGEMAQRLMPGGGVLLEWPPPGLETMHGKLRGVTRLIWVGSALVLATGLTLIVGGPMLPSIFDSVAMDLLLLLGGIGVAVTIAGTRRAITLGRAATVAVRHGYAWLTVAETIVDPDGETGDLLTGSRRFALLASANRSSLRQGRLIRAGAMLLGGLAPIPALVLLLILGTWVSFDHWNTLAVLLLPAAAGLVGSRLAARERSLAPAPKREPRSVESLEAERLAPAWYESFARARVGQALGHGSRRGARIGVYGSAIVALVAALVVVVLVPLATFASFGSILFASAMPKFSNTMEKLRLAEVARPFALSKDARISPMEAGRAFYALGHARPNTGPFLMLPLPPRAPRPWTGHRAGPALFATARPDSWAGPAASHILEAVPRGFSAEELAYLRMVATAPVWRDWSVVARAAAGDILGATFAIPFPDEATVSAMPIPQFGAIKELAYASMSRAAYHLALKQADSAEVAIRETISVGFFLMDNGNMLLDQLIGGVIVGIGRSGLTQFHELTRNPAGPALKAKWEAAVAAREARSEADVLDAAGRSAAKRDAPSSRRQVLALATRPSVPRGLRVEMLFIAGMAACSNVRELVFGPDREILDAFTRARQELARYPSELAFIDMIEDGPTRGAKFKGRDFPSRLVIGAASGVGFLLHNRRLPGCIQTAVGESY